MNRIPSFLIAFLSTFFVTTAYAQATIKETSEDIVTYGFSDPNPIAEPEAPIYPYFRFEGYEHKGTPKKWKVIQLENPYISVSLLPEAGGKIWGAINKVTGVEFLYKNNVMKFRNIAMRGPWTSGGVEFNFGLIGHIPSTSTPVDYLTRKNADGSVSCLVASYEWSTHTWWEVEVTVPTDKAWFTTHTIYHNASFSDAPYYHWMNAAYHAYDDAQFVYPGNGWIGHDGRWNPFPIDKDGNNLGTMRGCDSLPSVSMHVLGDYNQYNGVYYPEHGYGSLRWAEYADKIGQKIFLWGKARSGAIWEDLLTDGHGQYVELQSGRFFNQPSTGSERTPYKKPHMDPQATDEWTEYWFPVMGIGGVVKASPFAALNVERKDGKLILKLSPLETLDTDMRIYCENKLMKTIHVNATPLKEWQSEMLLTTELAEKGSLRVILGNELLDYSEKVTDNVVSRPTTTPSDFEWSSAYGQYLLGRNALDEKQWRAANEHFSNSLQKEPYFVPSLTAMADLCLRRGMTKESLSYALKALSVDAYDGMANYLYGLASRRLGHTTDAKDGFSMATRQLTTRTAAWMRLAEQYAVEGDLTHAFTFTQRALEAEPDNLSAQRLKVSILRLMGRNLEAKKTAQAILDKAPLYSPMRVEQWLLGEMDTKALTMGEQCELPAEVWLEIASAYEEIGDWGAADSTLSLAKDHPIACYHRAFIAHQRGNDSQAKQLINKADAQSPMLIFPHRDHTMKALEWVCTQSSNWKPAYYKALIFWGWLQNDRAKAILDSIPKADYAPFYLTRARLKEGDNRLDDLKQAERLQPSWRTGLALTEYYLSIHDYAHAESMARKYLKKYPKNYIIGLKYAKALCMEGKYDQCSRYMKTLDVLPNEGAQEGHVVYKTAHLGFAISLMQKGQWDKAQEEVEQSYSYPENLGVGKPFERHDDQRVSDFLLARIAESRGDQVKAKALYQKVTAHKPGLRWHSTDVLNVLALRAIGQTVEADSITAKWKAESSDLARWANAVCKGDYAAAAKAASVIRQPKNGAVWENTWQDPDFDILQILFR